MEWILVVSSVVLVQCAALAAAWTVLYTITRGMAAAARRRRAP